MINAIPIIGWLVSALFAAFISVPFWFVWTVCGIGDVYFFFLPAVWRTPGFGACVGIFIAVDIIKDTLLPTLSLTIEDSRKKSSEGKRAQ